MLDHVQEDLGETYMADEGARQLLDMVGECIWKVGYDRHTGE
jgi:hypothetical protein